MEHFVCRGGCGGVTDVVGATCQAEACPDHGKPLHACACEDGTHDPSAEETEASEQV